MELYDFNYLSPKQVDSLNSKLNKENNPYICETAGFEPLEVKFKRFEQNGIIAALQSEMFNSHDYREIYLDNPDFEITPEDDMEEAMEKFTAQQLYAESLKKSKLFKAASNGLNEEAGTEEPEKEKAAKKEAAEEE